LKILHTSDIHLRDKNDERWEALLHLITICKNEQINLLTISGDLFDRGIDSEKLRPDLREIFSDNGFRIIIIPGNHDVHAYRGGKYYGNDVTVLLDVENPFETQEICIWGLPYTEGGELDVLRSLHLVEKRICRGKSNILLYHGELLDAFFSRGDFGEEGKQRYMPARLSYFQKVGFDYVLAGHFHTTFDLIPIENNKYFVYPGSPVSISRREQGIRKVCIIESGKAPREYSLDTSHYQMITVKLNPFSSMNPVEIVSDSLKKAHPRAKIILNVDGYIDSRACGIKESDLSSALLREVRDRCVELNFGYMDIQKILHDELYLGFREKLEARNYDPRTKDELNLTAIKAMTEAGI